MRTPQAARLGPRFDNVAASKKSSARSNVISGFLRSGLERLILGCAYAYPLSLLLLCGCLLEVGEDWWVTAGLLYVPRLVFAAPLVVLVPALLLLRYARLLWTQAAALLIVVFPLMGFVLPWPEGRSTGPALRVLSLNVDSGNAGAEPLMRQLDAIEPDLGLFQESRWGEHGPIQDGLRKRFRYVHFSTQFLIGSRFPILEHTEPDKLRLFEHDRSPRYVRYVIDSPLGALAVYNIHPISPRGTLGIYGSRSGLRAFAKRQLTDPEPGLDLARNAALRAQQIAAVAASAAGEGRPVLIAGDTNLPGLSKALHRSFARYRDAFSSAGWGLGYTYNQRHAFARLDRMLASAELDFRDFKVGCPGASDHYCIHARVVRR